MSDYSVKHNDTITRFDVRGKNGEMWGVDVLGDDEADLCSAFWRLLLIIEIEELELIKIEIPEYANGVILKL